MNKLACLAWLLLMTPSIKQPTLLFENGTNHTMQNECLILEAKEPFVGVLYHDDKLYQSFKEDDFQEGKVVFEISEAGIYTLFNQEDEYIARAIYQDDQFHIAFNTPVKQKEATNYLFQRTPTTWILSPIEDETREPEKIGDGYFYEMNATTFTFFDEDYALFVDDTQPIVTVAELYELEKDTYITHQSEITLSYSDTYPEAFGLTEIVENDFQIKIQLNEGVNDLSCWLVDKAGNQGREKLWVIKDTKEPVVKLEEEKIYTNQSKTIEIDELYLDFTQSYYLWNGQRMRLEEASLTFEESGWLELYLFDLAGNTSNKKLQMIYDIESPTYAKTIENNQLSLTFSEMLKSQSIFLIHNDYRIDLSDLDSYVFVEEGDYRLLGEFLDLAGNRSVIDESFVVDLYPPQLEVSVDDGAVFHQKTIFQMSVDDTYLKEWEIQVLRNQTLIHTYSGTDAFNQEITLDDEIYEDGFGKYDIVVWASDGKYENQIVKTVILDTKCAPIQVQINGYEASNVTSLFLTNSILFDLFCEESTVMWHLYTKEGLVKSGEGESLMVLEDKAYTKLELTAEDSYGFTQSKTIYFASDKTNIELLDEVEEKSIEDKIASETEELIKIPKPELIKAVVVTNQEKSNIHLFVLGGILLATIALRQYIFRNLRFRKDKPHLSDQEELSLQDSKDTILLSTSGDKTNLLLASLPTECQSSYSV